MRYLDIIITAEMLKVAEAAVPEAQVPRTIASPIDTLAGHIGELAFAEWFLCDWKAHNLLGTKGKPDFLERIEIKASACPFRDTLNLLVREDYAAKRKPECYVQVIIDTPHPYVKRIEPGWTCRISGWATSDEVDGAPRRDFGRKGGGPGGYLCHYIQIRNLHSMEDFPIRRRH